MKVKEKSEKVGLKLNIQRTKIMASGPITSRQIDGETVAEVLSSQSYGFSSGHVWMWVLDYKESWVLRNWCFWTVVLEKTLGCSWTERRSNQSILKGISPGCSLEGLMLKLQYFATWCEELTHLKRPWFWERLRAGEEGDDRGWDGWMASRTQWTWVWVSSGSWWWTGKPGVLQSRGLQRVKHNWASELNWLS